MGSYRKSIMTGFVCRLCSQHKCDVLHMYSAKAKSLELLKKIALLPITVRKYDNLPKTICFDCIEKLDMQYKLIQSIRESYALQVEHITSHAVGSPVECPVGCPLEGLNREECGLESNPEIQEATSIPTNNIEMDDDNTSMIYF